MMKHKLFPIILVILSVLMTNFSFALVAKDNFVHVSNHTMTQDSLHMNHHSDKHPIQCEIYCDALMMSCALGISNLNNTELSHSHIILKQVNIFSDDALYSIDLIHDQKPPIFS